MVYEFLGFSVDIASLEIFVIFLMAVFFVIVILSAVITRLLAQEEMKRSLNMALFLVTLPKQVKDETKEKEKNEKELVAVMEQLYATLAKLDTNFLYGPSHFSFEIAVASTSQEIGFYVGAPRKFEKLIEKQIHSFYATAQVERVEDYNIFMPTSFVAGKTLTLSNDFLFPIRTYQNLEFDPLNNITNTLSKLPIGEGASVQLLIKPVSSSWKFKSFHFIKQVQKEGLQKAVTDQKFVSKINKIFQSKPKKDPNNPVSEELYRLSPLDEEAIKLIEGKANKTGFMVNIRIIAAAPEQERAKDIVNEIERAFSQFEWPNLNSFKIGKIESDKERSLSKFSYNFIFRNFEKSKPMILNTEELASIFHFPTIVLETPKVKWLATKNAPPPQNLSAEGLILGYNIYRGEEMVIKIAREDRRRHLYAIGQTGTGKSNFFAEMIKRDIAAGEGVCVIDPHGDLVDNVLTCIPENRVEDVIVFDPSDTVRPLGLNMLEVASEDQKDFAVQEMITIFYKLFPPEMIGPMFEHNMRNVMLTLMADAEYPGTIAEIPRMFTDTEFQKLKVSKVTNPVVRSFWEKEMAKTSDFHKSEMLGYLISKIGRFVENSMMRNIIGQEKSGFNLREIMDKQKILLVNLSKGKTGEVNSSLLGLIIVSKLQMAAMSRTDIPQEQRKDFYLYIDEFHNFTTDSIATILSEARKYRLNLNIAHQFIAQLPENIRDAVFGNVGTLVSFRIGADDAEFVAKQFMPVFNEQDLINIDNYNAYIKLMINGTVNRSFNMHIYAPTKGSTEIALAVKELSRLKYGRPREIVEKRILERSQLGSSLAKSSATMVPGEKIS
ncbi:MAG: type IV secretion system DNA-binding domain-containing protein [bacterium]|nr:type IV secretion system DNA-binding domain-containing protein [bacterium]